MITKNQAKFIRSLQQKKFRQKYNLFIAEGHKLVGDLASSQWPIREIFTSHNSGWQENSTAISKKIMAQISGLKQPPGVLAVCEIPKKETFIKKSIWVPVLDNVRDPGNLGTIIRLCDWFGFRQLVCSPDTVDPYNPKVIQACMGSIARVKVYQKPLGEFLTDKNTPVMGTFMNGDNLFDTTWPDGGFIVFGNEANGIQPQLEALCTKRITIPSAAENGAESLNVATSAAIVFAELFASLKN